MGESGNIGAKELQKLRHDLGLDRPYYEQYLIWLWQMVSLHPGRLALHRRAHHARSLAKAIPVTLELADARPDPRLVIVGSPSGCFRPRGRTPPSDYVGRVVAVSGLSLPDFWLGTLVITFAAIWFHWIPPIGYVSFWESPVRNLQQFLLPAAVLGFRLSAATMRMTRSTVLEVLREDYVRTAWAKGLEGRIVVYKHALLEHVEVAPVVTRQLVGGRARTGFLAIVMVETTPCAARPFGPAHGAKGGCYPLPRVLPGGAAAQRDAGGGHPRYPEACSVSPLTYVACTRCIRLPRDHRYPRWP